MDEASFEERADLISKLGIEVYPSEDLRSMRVKCRLGHGRAIEQSRDAALPRGRRGGGEAHDECGKVSSAPPQGIRTPEAMDYDPYICLEASRVVSRVP